MEAKIKRATPLTTDFYTKGQDFEIEFSNGYIYELRAKGWCDDNGDFNGEISLSNAIAFDNEGEAVRSEAKYLNLIYEYLQNEYPV